MEVLHVHERSVCCATPDALSCAVALLCTTHTACMPHTARAHSFSCPILPHVVSQIIDAFRSNETAVRVEMANLGLGDRAAQAWALVLGVNQNITALNLEGNRIGTEGVQVHRLLTALWLEHYLPLPCSASPNA